MKLLFFVSYLSFFSQIVSASSNLTFLNYCSQPHQNKEVQVTVKALLEITGNSDCKKSFEELKEKQFLSLENSQITNLLPLVGLDKIETLDLSNNKIKTLWGIDQLPNLKIIYLANNQIDETTPLALLEKLEIIDLSHNLIEKVAPLKDIKSIKLLHIHDNPVNSNEEAMDYLESMIFFRKLQQRGMGYDWPPESVEEGLIEINSASKRGDLHFIKKVWKEQSLRVAISVPSFFNSLDLKTKRAFFAVKYSSDIASRLVDQYKKTLSVLPSNISLEVDQYFDRLKFRLERFLEYFIIEGKDFPFQENDLNHLEKHLHGFIQSKKSLNLESIADEVKRWVTVHSRSGIPLSIKSGFYAM